MLSYVDQSASDLKLCIEVRKCVNLRQHELGVRMAMQLFHNWQDSQMKMSFYSYKNKVCSGNIPSVVFILTPSVLLMLTNSSFYNSRNSFMLFVSCYQNKINKKSTLYWRLNSLMSYRLMFTLLLYIQAHTVLAVRSIE